MRKPAPESDLLYGVSAIAAHLEMRPRQVHHLIDKAGLPVFKIAGRVCARKTSLRRWMAECEAKAQEGRP